MGLTKLDESGKRRACTDSVKSNEYFDLVVYRLQYQKIGTQRASEFIHSIHRHHIANHHGQPLSHLNKPKMVISNKTGRKRALR